MTESALHLFGPPRLESATVPVPFGRRKAMALLAYLAVTQQPHGRDVLAALLWPELNQRRARAMVRRALVTLGHALGPGWIETVEDQVSLLVGQGLWIDVNHFWRLLADVVAHDHAPHHFCDGCISALIEAAISITAALWPVSRWQMHPNLRCGSLASVRRCTASWPQCWRSW